MAPMPSCAPENKREFVEHGDSLCLKILLISDYLVYTVALATIRPRSVSKFLREASLRSAPNSCAGDVCLVRLPVASTGPLVGTLSVR